MYSERNSAGDFTCEVNHALSRSTLMDWNALLSETISDMAVAGRGAEHFAGKWSHFRLGPIDLNFIKASPQAVVHCGSAGRAGRTQDFDLVYLKRGVARVRHRGHSVVAEENAFVLLDNAYDYELTFEDDSLGLTVHLSADWLMRWVPDPSRCAGRLASAGAGWGRPLASLLETIAAEGLDTLPVQRGVLADQIGAFVALLGGPTPDIGSAGRHAVRVLDRIKAAMRDRQLEADLSPEAVAAGVGVSKRQLHALFARNGETFGAFLMELRLERAAAMLADARLDGLQIGEVAYNCGFAEQSHFARRFRGRFGVSPRRFRQSRAS